MAEMAQFLKPGDFQRPSEGDSKKLKLKKPKKDKKEKKVICLSKINVNVKLVFECEVSL